MASSTKWKRALVTGASSGLGAEFCSQLAAAGTDLVLVARNGERLETLATNLSSRHNVACEVLPADLTTEAGVRSVAERLSEDQKAVDLLVNNAGLGYIGEVISIAAERHTEQINLNVLALTQLSHSGAQAMVRRGGGTILNVSSIAGDIPGPKSAVYNATKSFVTSFSQSLGLEMAESGVVVSCLCPGLTRTEFQDRAGYDASDIPDRLWQEPAPVVRVGLAAASEGKALVTSGAINKTWSRLMRAMPRALSRKASELLNRK